jgi:hypothetical protein
MKIVDLLIIIDSRQSISFDSFIIRVRTNEKIKKFESLILAQNERWRYALTMQVERERVAISE